jgi:hypothetical protein
LFKLSTYDDIEYYTKAVLTDSETLVTGKQGTRAADRVSTRFGHPALYKPLMTPMVHAKAADTLEKIIQGRLGTNGGVAADYSDIIMHNMSTSEPGKPGGKSADAPFEVVSESQLDFSYFKERPDFRDEFGGGIYGRPDDLITERSHTPKSFMGGTGSSSPRSSRSSSPAPSQFSRRQSGGLDGLQNRFPNISDPPAAALEFYNASNESERRLLNNEQGSIRRSSGDIGSMDRWTPGNSNGYEADDPNTTSYETYGKRF